MKEFDSDRSAAIRAALIEHVGAPARHAWRPRVWGTALLASGVLIGAGTTAVAVGVGPEGENVPRLALTMETFQQLSELPGFVGGGPASAGSDDLVIYWSGPLAEAERVAQHAKSQGVNVRFESTLRAPADLWSDAIALADALIERGIEVTGFGPNRSYDAVELMGPELSINPQLQQLATELAAGLLSPGVGVAFLPNETGLTFPADTPSEG